MLSLRGLPLAAALVLLALPAWALNDDTPRETAGAPTQAAPVAPTTQANPTDTTRQSGDVTKKAEVTKKRVKAKHAKANLSPEERAHRRAMKEQRKADQAQQQGN